MLYRTWLHHLPTHRSLHRWADPVYSDHSTTGTAPPALPRSAEPLRSSHRHKLLHRAVPCLPSHAHFQTTQCRHHWMPTRAEPFRVLLVKATRYRACRTIPLTSFASTAQIIRSGTCTAGRSLPLLSFYAAPGFSCIDAPCCSRPVNANASPSLANPAVPK